MTEETEDNKRFFSWEDYAVFAAMLALSAVIGAYHGFSCGRKKKQVANGAGEFLTGSGQMKTFPVALSMLASYLSSITLMGQPAEVYLFGPQLWIFGLATFIALPFVGYVFVPFFRKLNATSAYEYFGRRFGRKLQLFASVLFTLQMVLYLALVLYAPALALHQVTGINTMTVVSAMYIVCIFYTTIGGMKAVVWTDTFQVIILYSAMIAVLIKGTFDVGGINTVWTRNIESGRNNFFNFNFDPTERYTFWTTSIGAAFLHTAIFGANQLQIQRYMTVPTIKEARKLLWISAAGWAIVVLLTVYAGMLIYAKFYLCDPLGNHEIKSPDQLFPLFVMDVLGEYHGFPGLFVAGIFSAGLSTVSTGVNSLAAIWFSELDGTKFKKGLSQTKATLTVKSLAFIFGLLSFFLVFLVPYMGTLVPVAISLSSFFSGSLLGLFILGMYFPITNTLGAFFGLVTGVGLVGYMTIGVQISIENGYQVYNVLPLSTEGCDVFNATISSIDIEPVKEPAMFLFRVSFLWYSFISTIVTIIVGLIVSVVTKCITRDSPFSNICHKTTQVFNCNLVSKPQKITSEHQHNIYDLVPNKHKSVGDCIFIPDGRDKDVRLLPIEKCVSIKPTGSR